MPLQADLAGKMQGGAFAVQGILCEPAERGEGHKKRRELRVIDKLEMERFLLGRLGARD